MPKLKYKKPRRRKVRRTYSTPQTTGTKRGRKKNSYLKGVLGTVGIIALVFLGYSVGAPIKKYLDSRKTQDVILYESDSSEMTVLTDDFIQETTISEVQTELPEEKSEYSSIRACEIPLSAMNDMEQIEKLLAQIRKEGYNAAVFTLKAHGGDFYYNTESSFASFANENIKSDIYASELAMAAQKQGLMAIGRVSFFADSYGYTESFFGSFTESDGELWKDADGRSWLSPLDSNAVAYIEEISYEIADAGFSCIICSDVCYPQFGSEDYGRLGEAVGYGDRSMYLERAVRRVLSRVSEFDCHTIVEIGAGELMSDNSEIMKAADRCFDHISVVCSNNDDIAKVGSVDGLTVIFSGKNLDPAGCDNYIINDSRITDFIRPEAVTETVPLPDDSDEDDDYDSDYDYDYDDDYDYDSDDDYDYDSDDDYDYDSDDDYDYDSDDDYDYDSDDDYDYDSDDDYDYDSDDDYDYDSDDDSDYDPDSYTDDDE